MTERFDIFFGFFFRSPALVKMQEQSHSHSQPPSSDGNTSGVLNDGSILAGARQAAFETHHADAPQPQNPPLYPGSIADFERRHPERLAQLRNVVRRCARCDKVCALTAESCNACGAHLPLELTHSPNVFMGFIYGVGRVGAAPLTISIRDQTPDVLVFDDFMASSPCHLNAIPTARHIRDWRLLLRSPSEGLALLTQLEERLWACVRDQFLARPAWRAKFMSPHASQEPLEALRPHLILGVNYPPSQFQLHVQCIMPPLTPNHYRMYLEGKPLLPRGASSRWHTSSSSSRSTSPWRSPPTPPSTRLYSATRLAPRTTTSTPGATTPWAPPTASSPTGSSTDFALRVEPAAADSSSDVFARDKLVLQGYGRPYGPDGKPSGTHYLYAREEACPSEVFAHV